MLAITATKTVEFCACVYLKTNAMSQTRVIQRAIAY